VFKGFSQCIPSVSIFYFGPFNPFHSFVLLLYLPLFIIQEFSVHILISSTFTDVMFYDVVDTLSFFFFLKFYSVVSVLQICFACEFLYDHAYFCVYVYILDLSSTYKVFVFLLLFFRLFIVFWVEVHFDFYRSSYNASNIS
jgi:hypothetical protein